MRRGDGISRTPVRRRLVESTEPQRRRYTKLTPPYGEYKNDGWSHHTVIFLYYAVASYLAHLGNYISALGDRTIERKHTVFTITYTIALTFVPIVYGTIIIYGDDDPNTPPPVSPYITQAVDILWLGHMLCEQYYAPPEKPFEMTLKLLDIEKQEE